MLNYFFLKHLLQARRNQFSTSLLNRMNLIGRNYLIPKDLSVEETKSIMWTALDLKHLYTSKYCEINNINSSRITLLMEKSLPEIQAAATSAACLLKSHLNIIVDPNWDSLDFVGDVGSFFSTCTDMIFCQSKYHSRLEIFAKGTVVPVVNVSSCMYTILNVLADIMAIQERYGYLKHINVGWIGAPCPIINTYLVIAPKFGLNIQYCCTCASGSQISPAALPEGQKHSKRMHTSLVECKTAFQAISDAQVIALAKHGVKDYKLTLSVIQAKARSQWSLLHVLPRSTVEVDSEVFEHENSLVWEAKGNLQWICAALMIRFLSRYQHYIKKPNFDK